MISHCLWYSQFKQRTRGDYQNNQSDSAVRRLVNVIHMSYKPNISDPSSRPISDLLGHNIRIQEFGRYMYVLHFYSSVTVYVQLCIEWTFIQSRVTSYVHCIAGLVRSRRYSPSMPQRSSHNSAGWDLSLSCWLNICTEPDLVICILGSIRFIPGTVHQFGVGKKLSTGIKEVSL